MTAPAGWYDDGSGQLRWWDGTQWTVHVAALPQAAASEPPTPAPVEPTPAPVTTEPTASATAPGPVPESEAFVPPYALPAQTPHPAAAPAPGSPGAIAYPMAPASAPSRKISVLGLIGLGAAVVGVVLSCIPPIAVAGWIVLGLALVLSLISLFLPGTKWPGITGLGVTFLGAILAAAVALISLGISADAEADDAPAVSPSESPQADDDTSTDTEDPSAIEGAEMVFVSDLEVGDCLPLVEDWQEEVSDVPVVPCDQPHTDEVYYVTELPDGDFPGDEALQSDADALCVTEFETFIGVDYDTSELDYYWYIPTKASWNRWDDREIHCIAFSYEDVTGTLQGAAR